MESQEVLRDLCVKLQKGSLGNSGDHKMMEMYHETSTFQESCHTGGRVSLREMFVVGSKVDVSGLFT